MQIAISGSASQSLTPISPTFSGTNRFESAPRKAIIKHMKTCGISDCPIQFVMVYGRVLGNASSCWWGGGGRNLVMVEREREGERGRGRRRARERAKYRESGRGWERGEGGRDLVSSLELIATNVYEPQIRKCARPCHGGPRQALRGGYSKSQFSSHLSTSGDKYPQKWLQDRANGSMNALGMPPRRASCGALALLGLVQLLQT
jgi:hypothetical protein